MPAISTRVLPLALCLLAAGCASRPLPKYEKPLARAQFQHVRTTAYTHTEGDHLQYSNRNACGDTLQSGDLKSAACDWSRWPVGTVFRIQETGETYIVDDYGWALAGTNTIDLYKPTRSAMNTWGVRRVHIETIRWGDPQRSLAILRPRSKYRHVRRMVDGLEDRYTELSRPLEVAPANPIALETPPVARPTEPAPAPVAVAVAKPLQPFRATTAQAAPTDPARVPLTPFSVSATR